MVQTREGCAKMARKVTQDDIDKWKELRGRGYTHERIGKETNWGPETVRKYVGEGGGPLTKGNGHEKPQGAQEIEAEAFRRYDQKETPLDLVKTGFTTTEKAEELWEKFVRLKTISDHPPGFNEGHKKGFAEAKERYLVKIPCAKCGKDIEIINPDLKIDLSFLLDSVISTDFKFIRGENERSWTWSHAECIKKAGG